jgi:hypothetical protein
MPQGHEGELRCPGSSRAEGFSHELFALLRVARLRVGHVSGRRSAGNQRAGRRIPRLPALRNPSQRVRLREIARARINEKTSSGPASETGRARALEAVAVRRCAGAGLSEWQAAQLAIGWLRERLAVASAMPVLLAGRG